MDQDILFKTDGLIFSYRGGGIAIRGGHVLLQRPKNDDFAVIGGHVRGMETGEEALKREFLEELHAQIEVNRLIAAGEIFFPWNGMPCHQICLYYDISLQGSGVPEDKVRVIVGVAEGEEDAPECLRKARSADMTNSAMSGQIWISYGFRWKT